jgi:DNA-binding transcriptional LysR family regulator
MDAGDLKVFEAVARLGAMNRAAAELNTVQSNVTARIRVLEDALGLTLFERHSRGVALTAAGQRLLPYAHKVRDLLAEAHRAVVDDGLPKGLLTIGTLETTAALRLSPLLAGYVERWPDVDLVLRTGTTEEMIAATVERRVEGAFVCGPVDHADLLAETVYQEELVLVSARHQPRLDPLLGRPGLKLIVLRAGCSYRARLEAILAARGVAGTRLLEFGTLDALLACVAAGVGITLMPRRVVTPLWREGRIAIHDLPAAEALVDTQFIRRADGFASSALAAFLDIVRAPQLAADAAD